MKRIAIIGGGLAGCAAAFVLKRAGLEPVIFEAGPDLAGGASGNAVGLYNPRFGAEWSPQSQYFSQGFFRALEVFEGFSDIAWNASGCLHLVNDEKKLTRYSKMMNSWGWADDEMVWLSDEEASDVSGVQIDHDALFLPRSGTVCPPKLCAAYAEGVEVHYDSVIDDVDAVEADVVLLCAGPALRGFDVAKDLDLRAVRGQVTMIKEALPMTTNICYSGYVTQALDGEHMVGSTFQRWLDHNEIIDADDGENLERLSSAIPSAPASLEVTARRASVRTTSKDHFPVVGPLSERVYMSSAHGSHGILSSLMAAEILAAMLTGAAMPVSDDMISALSPHRFLD